ncbi:MAG: MoaD family protein [Candidatus Euphemobacter frigidus]|nr:MoaD family protein [Candidatus Euphemobacter frigidus]
MITVRFYSLLRDKLGKKEVKVEARNVAQAMDRLKEIFGSRWTDALYKGGRMNESYIFLINGQRIFLNNFPETRLDDEEMLHIFPPVAGG